MNLLELFCGFAIVLIGVVILSQGVEQKPNSDDIEASVIFAKTLPGLIVILAGVYLLTPVSTSTAENKKFFIQEVLKNITIPAASQTTKPEEKPPTPSNNPEEKKNNNNQTPTASKSSTPVGQ